MWVITLIFALQTEPRSPVTPSGICSDQPDQQAQHAECVSIPHTAEALQHRQLAGKCDDSTLRNNTFEALHKRF